PQIISHKAKRLPELKSKTSRLRPAPPSPSVVCLQTGNTIWYVFVNFKHFSSILYQSYKSSARTKELAKAQKQKLAKAQKRKLTKAQKQNRSAPAPPRLVPK
ncbi:MAG: hypothetical protein LQ346_003622, partial [Caloplaca aetnensis]